MIIEITIVAFLSVALRFLFIMGKSEDQNYHYNNIRRIAHVGIGFPDVSDSLTPGKQIYPPLPHRIIAFFPQRLWNLAGRLLNIFYDVLTIAIVYGMGIYLSSSCGLSALAWAGLSPAGWVALLFATCPLLFPISARLKAAGGRTMGLLFSTIYFIGVAGVYLHHSVFCFCLALLAGIATLISSNFSSQAIVLMSLFLSIIMRSYVPLIVITSVIIIALLITPLKIWLIVKENWCHYVWYWKNVDGVSAVDERNRWSDVLKMPVRLFTNPVDVVKTVFQRNSLIIALCSLPIMPSILIWYVRGVHIGNPLLERFCWSMFLSGLAAFALTSFRPFVIFGQAERYLENAAPYAIVIFVAIGLQKGNEAFFLPLLVWNVVIVLANFFFIMRGEYAGSLKTAPPDGIDEILKVMESSCRPRVLTIPTKLAYVISAFVRHEDIRFYFDWIMESRRGYAYMMEEQVRYQYPKQDIGFFKRVYGVNTVIIRKSALNEAAMSGTYYELSSSQTVFENEQYIVLSV